MEKKRAAPAELRWRCVFRARKGVFPHKTQRTHPGVWPWQTVPAKYMTLLKGTAAPAHTPPPQGPQPQSPGEAWTEASLRREVTSLPARLRPSFRPSPRARVARDAPLPASPLRTALTLYAPVQRNHAAATACRPAVPSLPAAIRSLQSAGHHSASRERRCGQLTPGARARATAPQPAGPERQVPLGADGTVQSAAAAAASVPPPGLCFWRRIRDPKCKSPKRVFRPDPTPAPTQTRPRLARPLTARKVVAAPPRACAESRAT